MTGNSVQTHAGPLHLLVVDDNTINIRLMAAALTRQGHMVDSADDGTVAVAKFTENHYDAILMDIMMPVMDGITATREIRRIESERQTTPDQRVKIIAITANAFDDDRSKLFEAGMDHYMTKPIDIIELQRLLSL
ncbi:MAG: response regulator [Bacteroidales bacterium]